MRVLKPLILAPVLIVGTTACDSTSEPRTNVPVTLSFAVNPAAGLAGLSAAGTYATANASELTLETVTLNIDRIVLEREDGLSHADSDGDSDSHLDSDGDSDSDGGTHEEWVVNGAAVDLPVAGGVITPFSEPVPAGLYEEIELDIESIRVAGIADGEAFDVVVPVDIELEMEFESLLEVAQGDEPFNISVTVDPYAWFLDDDGSFIDPRDLANDGALLNRVRQRMALTFAAFEDSDRDGDDFDSDSDSDSF